MANVPDMSDDKRRFRGLALRTVLIGPVLLASLLFPSREPIQWAPVGYGVAMLAVIAVVLVVLGRRPEPTSHQAVLVLTHIAAFIAVFFGIVAANDPGGAVPYALVPILVFQAGNASRRVVLNGWFWACAAYGGGMLAVGLPLRYLPNQLWIFAMCSAIAMWIAYYLVAETNRQHARAAGLAELTRITASCDGVVEALHAATPTLREMTGASEIELADDDSDADETHRAIEVGHRFFVLVEPTDTSQFGAIADLLGQVAEREGQLAELERLTRTDPLTGVGNRLVLQDLVAGLGTEKSITVVMLDLDHFKAYNDEFGHLAGDEVLRQFAETLSSQVREPDVAVRWGGEEFCLLLDATPMQANVIVDRIRTLWESRCPVTFSAGIAESAPDPVKNGSLIDRADAALYEAKSHGRNRTVLANPTSSGGKPTTADEKVAIHIDELP